jgi:NTP pyrophosphatase (non-canonical NTP hydrolase)
MERSTSKSSLDEVLDLVKAERIHQDDKWGPSVLRPTPGLVVLVEEVGEVANAMLESDSPELVKELIQVAAVAVAMVEGCFRGDVPRR